MWSEYFNPAYTDENNINDSIHGIKDEQMNEWTNEEKTTDEEEGEGGGKNLFEKHRDFICIVNIGNDFLGPSGLQPFAVLTEVILPSTLHLVDVS